MSQVLQDGALLAVGDLIMEADDPRGDFIAETIRRNWLTRNGGFVLDRPGPGFELVCTTMDGSARIQHAIVESTQGQYLELLWHSLKGQLGHTCTRPLLTCVIAGIPSTRAAALNTASQNALCG